MEFARMRDLADQVRTGSGYGPEAKAVAGFALDLLDMLKPDSQDADEAMAVMVDRDRIIREARKRVVRVGDPSDSVVAVCWSDMLEVILAIDDVSGLFDDNMLRDMLGPGR